MAFGATLTVTINTVAKILNRIREQDYGSEWSLYEPTGKYILYIRHTTRTDKVTGRKFHRHNMELIHTVYATTTTPEYKTTHFATSELPEDLDMAIAKLEWNGFAAYASNATVVGDWFNWLS